MRGTLSDNAPCAASARGILLCLHMLADEAASLGLGRTLDAVLSAIEACEAERGARASLADCVH